MYLFDLASRHMNWLSERQAVTAANIANADTPGYQARDTVSFSDFVQIPEIRSFTTSPMHMGAATGDLTRPGRTEGGSWASSHSGNNVTIEQELMKASSANRMMSVDASIARAFQRMLLLSVKA